MHSVGKNGEMKETRKGQDVVGISPALVFGKAWREGGGSDIPVWSVLGQKA